MKKRRRAKPQTQISGLRLTNFRGFRHTPAIELAPLTFLVGPNSSGKSSIADAIFLLAQSNLFRFTPKPPVWSGGLVDLGSFKDTVWKHNTKLEIGVSLSLTIDSNEIVLTYAIVGAKDPIGQINRFSILHRSSGATMEVRRRKGRYPSFCAKALGIETIWTAPRERDEFAVDYDFIRFLIQSAKKAKARASKSNQRGWRAIATLFDGADLWRMSGAQRVSSGRSGPKRWYPRTTPRDPYYYGERSLFETVEPQLLARQAHDRSVDILDELSRQLRRLRIATDIRPEHLSAYHSVITVDDSVTGVAANLSDVGYGASQVLPVLRALLSRAQGVLFIEQPEIHLHPQAQGDLAELIATASLSRQVVVETHSEHMINRARLQVARGQLPKEHVIIQYVDRRADGSFVVPIRLDNRGDFTSAWPNGFFDERYKDTMALAAVEAR